MPTKVPRAKVILANSADAMVSADGTALVLSMTLAAMIRSVWRSLSIQPRNSSPK